MNFKFESSVFFYRMLFALVLVSSPAIASAQSAGSSCIFAAAVNYSAGDRPLSVAIGDLDGDLDLAVATYFTDDVSVLMNNGDGTFAAHATYSTGDRSHSVAIGDLDGDFGLDLAVANRDSDDVSVLLNCSAHGKDTQGTWTLELTDNKRRNTGTLNNWSIEVTAAGPPTISINDATINEGGSLDVFVPAGSGGLERPQGLTFGPDGNVYVATRSTTDNVLRFDGVTGEFLDEFVTSGSGGLNGPSYITFGPDGNLYVVNNGGGDNVLRYDGATGNFLDQFVTSSSGGLTIPSGLVFGANGDLYVTSQTDEVLRYDGLTGAFIEAFVPSGSGGLDSPSDLTIGPDGNLYVGSRGADNVLRYNGTTGTLIDEFIPSGSGGLNSPTSVLFGSHGYVYVGSGHGDAILRYDAITGAFVDEIVSSGLGGLDNPKQTAFGPDGNFYLLSRLSDQVFRYSEGLTVSLSSPSIETVTVDYASSDGSATAGSDYTAASGTLTFAPGETTKKILLVATDDVVVEQCENFVVDLSNPNAGVMITDSQGVATILDNDVVVTANSFLVTRGTHVSGGVAELAESDNLDLSIRRSTADTQSRTEFEVKAVSLVASPSSLEVTLEGSVFARSQVNQTIELRDYVAGQWEQVDTRAATRFTDSTVTVAATGDLSRFVEPGTMCMQARVRYQSPVARQRFASNTDQFVWTIGQ